MFCSNCGTQNEDGLNFCTRCGHALNASGQPQQVYQQPQTVPGKGQGIAAMVLGIIALVFFCVWYICFPCGITGLILGIIGNKKARAVGGKNGMATAGIVCSCIAIALWVLFLITVVVGVLSFGSAIENAFQNYYYY